MDRFDVIEVTMAAPHTVRVIASDKTEDNAEAIVSMAVMRRGVQAHFFTKCAPGEYKDGDPLKTVSA